jgi:hypothetical protein
MYDISILRTLAGVEAAEWGEVERLNEACALGLFPPVKTLVVRVNDELT